MIPRQSRLSERPDGTTVSTNVNYHQHGEGTTTQTVTHGGDEKVFVLRAKRSDNGDYQINVDATGVKNLAELTNAVIGFIHNVAHDVDGSCALTNLDLPDVVRTTLTPEGLAGAMLLANPIRLADQLEEALSQIIEQAENEGQGQA